MIATNVGRIGVVEHHIDVVDSVFSRRIVDHQRSFHVLLDDFTISGEG